MRSLTLCGLILLLCGAAQARVCEEKLWDKKFWGAVIATAGTTILDAETTSRGVRTEGLKEGNAVAASFTRFGRPAIYGVMGGTSALALYGSARMKQCGSKWWWTIPLAVSVGHGYYGGRNVSLLFRF